MKHKKKSIIIFTLILIIASILGGNVKNIKIFNAKHEQFNSEKKSLYVENKTTYVTEEGKTHNVYWAQGVNPPIITSNKEEQGKKGYFSVENINGYETYLSEFEPDKGYYDYNKNLDDRPDEHPLCYLGSASNLISWWLEQNKTYVNEYVRRLKETNIYGQDKKLYPILPFEESLWEQMRRKPGIEIQQGYKAQKIGKSPLATNLLKPYYHKKGDGYFVDMVLDFFFNGYDPIPQLEYTDPNTENNFVKDPRGGFFFPIFGKTRIVERLSGTNHNSYEFISKNLRKMFAEGKGISFGYEVGPLNAHAITVWGAEYDENNNLCRVYITDSDDYQPAKSGDEYWRGLVGFNTVKDKNGKLCLTNKVNPTSEKPGNYINHIVTLDLAQDVLENKLRDKSEPKDPKVLKQTQDKIYAKGANIELEIKAESQDSGYLEYEWYVSDTENGKGKLIPRENKDKIKPNTNEIGKKYYYCVITNIKNGKSAKIETKRIKVDVQNIELVNAQTPDLKFNYDTIKFKQYAPPTYPEIRVYANVKDGGILTYQWYQSFDNTADNGTKLEGETEPVLYPNTNQASKGLYYYCEVTNTNLNENITGNSKTTIKTPYAKRVIIEGRELKDAQDPLIIKEPKDLEINQYDEDIKLEVEAKLYDGGRLSYQWYEVNSDYTTKILEKETNPVLKIDTSVVGNKMYKCELINKNEKASQNKEKRISTNIISVDIISKNNLSNDNYLNDIVIQNGNINPKFDKNTTEYKVDLDHGIDKLDIRAVASDVKAKIEIDNPIIYIGQTKKVQIKVTAENGETRTYYITVTRSGEHTFSDWEVLEESTCTKRGKEKHICEVCGQEEIREIEKKEHEYEENWTIDIEATCEKEGSKSHHCKNCDARKDITKIEKQGHKFGNWEKSKKEEWKEQRICNICGEVEYRGKSESDSGEIKPEDTQNSKPDSNLVPDKEENNKTEIDKKPNEGDSSITINPNEADKNLPMTGGNEEPYDEEQLEIKDEIFYENRNDNFKKVMFIGLILVAILITIFLIRNKQTGKRMK